MANTSCCTYINTSGIVEECADDILQQGKQHQEQSLKTWVSTQVWNQIKFLLLSRTWFLPLLEPIVAIILLLVFWSCILNLLVKLVSSHLRIHQTTNAPDRDKNNLLSRHNLLSRSPLTPFSWSALMLQAPSSPPVSRKQLLNRLRCPYP
jgi:hypothetical protein